MLSIIHSTKNAFCIRYHIMLHIVFSPKIKELQCYRLVQSKYYEFNLVFPWKMEDNEVAGWTCVYRTTGCAVGGLHPDSVKQVAA